ADGGSCGGSFRERLEPRRQECSIPNRKRRRPEREPNPNPEIEMGLRPGMMTEKFPRTDDLRIKEIKELLAPDQIRRESPITEKAAQTTYDTRQEIHRVLHGADDRLLVIIGPCSIHDPKAALEYARKLKTEKDRCAGGL